MLHPDRFNSQSQRAEWELANEMLKELNHAYGLLKDPTSRSQYDRNSAETSSSSQKAPSQRSTPPSPPTKTSSSSASSSSFVAPAVGYGRFASFARPIQRKLVERQSGANKVQLRIPLKMWVGWNYVWLVVSATYFIAIWTSSVFKNAVPMVTQPQDPFAYAVGAMCAGFLIGRNASVILKWTRATLKSNLFVTPLYIIRTHFDEVWFWPITSLQNVNGTNHFYNGIYLSTKVTVSFADRVEHFKFRSKNSYPRFVAAFNTFVEKARMAAGQGDFSYFVSENDFLVAGKTSAPVRRSLNKASIGVYSVSFTIAAIMSAIAYQANVQRIPSASPDLSTAKMIWVPPDPVVEDDSTPNTATPLPTRGKSGAEDLDRYLASLGTPSPHPLYTLPRRTPASQISYSNLPNGFVYFNRMSRGSGSLKITNGTDYHAIVKLVRSQTSKSVYTVFVMAHNEVTIPKIPNGQYRLLFAAGRGWDALTSEFKEKHGFSEFENPLSFDTVERIEQGRDVLYFHDMEVTLNPVRGGTAKTNEIDDNEFAKY